MAKIERQLMRRLQHLDAAHLQIVLAKAIAALEKIADCNEGDLARYVAKVDGIAVDALVEIECMAD